MPTVLPALLDIPSKVAMDIDKKVIEELLGRVAALEDKSRTIHRTLLESIVSLENELHDFASSPSWRKLSRQVLVELPVVSPNPHGGKLHHLLYDWPIMTPRMEVRTVERELLDKLIDNLELSVRPANCLYGSLLKPILRVGDLIMFTESDLMKLKHFGRKSLREIEEVLASMGLSLGAVHVEWIPSPDSAHPEDLQEGGKP